MARLANFLESKERIREIGSGSSGVLFEGFANDLQKAPLWLGHGHMRTTKMHVRRSLGETRKPLNRRLRPKLIATLRSDGQSYSLAECAPFYAESVGSQMNHTRDLEAGAPHSNILHIKPLMRCTALEV